MQQKETIWDFSEQLSIALLIWSIFSMCSGWGMCASKRPLWRGIGIHFVVWGAIDAVIALIGWRNTQKNRALPMAEQAEKQAAESRKLRRLLWLNTALDVFYVWGGLWVYRNKGSDHQEWRGQGIGIIIQGGFLFFFDLIQAVQVPNTQGPHREEYNKLVKVRNRVIR